MGYDSDLATERDGKQNSMFFVIITQTKMIIKLVDKNNVYVLLLWFFNICFCCVNNSWYVFPLRLRVQKMTQLPTIPAQTFSFCVWVLLGIFWDFRLINNDSLGNLNLHSPQEQILNTQLESFCVILLNISQNCTIWSK